MTKTEWRWEQDGRGGLNGTATYFKGTAYEVSVPLPDFATANKLFHRIDEHVKSARQEARVALLEYIGNIQP